MRWTKGLRYCRFPTKSHPRLKDFAVENIYTYHTVFVRPAFYILQRNRS
jgi:hypothetical protein